MRGHIPIINGTFKGLWRRGNDESCPADHGLRYSNVTFDQGSVRSRQHWTKYADGGGEGVRRCFVYNDNNGKVFLIYITVSGNIFSKQILPTQSGPALLISTDFTHDIDVLTYNGRAYIATANKQGYIGQFLYVYDGVTVRLAGMDTPFPSATVQPIPGGTIDIGNHYFAVSYETDTGFISVPVQVVPTVFAFDGTQQARFANLPIAPAGQGVVARRLMATKVVPAGAFIPTTGISLYPIYFIPGGRIADNTTTTIDLNFTDTQLLDDVSYLNEIFPRPRGGSCLTIYHNRMIMGASLPSGATEGAQHIIAISRVNDIETFEIGDGTLVIDPTTDFTIQAETGGTQITGITEVQEYRDTLYAWKLASTYGIVDNGLEPSTWSVACLDQANGSFRNGVVTILDSGGINIEYLVVGNKNGLFVFNGMYNYPEITWKVRDLWDRIQKNPYSFTVPGINNIFGCVHFINDPLNKKMYCLVGLDNHEPRTILLCDYSETSITDSDYFMNVKWATFDHDFGATPSAIVAYDVLKDVKLLGFDYTSPNNIMEAGGAGLLMEPPHANFSGIASSIIRDDQESKILHFGGVTIAAIGNGVADSFINLSLNEPPFSAPARFIGLTSLTVNAINNRIKTIPTNFIAQKVFLLLTSAEMNVNNIQIWMRPMYKTLPFNG